MDTLLHLLGARELLSFDAKDASDHLDDLVELTDELIVFRCRCQVDDCLGGHFGCQDHRQDCLQI